MANSRISISSASPRTQQYPAFLAAYTPETIADAVLRWGTPRSAAYRAGLVDVLKFKMQAVPVQCPFPAGTVQFDAYFAGHDRGLAVYRANQEQQGGRHV